MKPNRSRQRNGAVQSISGKFEISSSADLKQQINKKRIEYVLDKDKMLRLTRAYNLQQKVEKAMDSNFQEEADNDAKPPQQIEATSLDKGEHK